MNKLIHLIFFLHCLLPLATSAQEQQKIDSLNRIIALNRADTIEVQTLVELAETQYLSDPNATLITIKKVLDLSEKLNYKAGISNACGWLAYLYEQKGEIDLALTYYQKSLRLMQELNNQKQVATCYNNIAAIYKDQGKIAEAISYHYKSLFIKIRVRDLPGIATSYNNLALIYQQQGRVPLALEFYGKAKNIYEQSKDLGGVSTTLQNIGTLYLDQKQFDVAAGYYRNALQIIRQTKDLYSEGYALNGLGGLFENQGKQDSALYYFNLALKVREQLNDKQGIAYSLNRIGNVYLHQQQIAEAKTTLQKSLVLFEEQGDKNGIVLGANSLGAVYLAEGNSSIAETYLNKSLQYARELGYPTSIKDAAYNLMKLYRGKQNWKSALEMNDLFIQMRDSIQNDNNKKTAIKTQFKYEYEKKEALLKKEQEKKEAISAAEISKQKLVRNGFMAGFAVVLLFAGIVFKQRNRIAKEKQRSEELLLNILPEETAEELKSTGSAKAKDFEQVTILFTDFKNFTRVSEQKTAQELVNEINYCYSEFDKIVADHGVEKIKTIGDAYMCAGGLPTANTTNAEDTLRAAIKIRDFMLLENQKRKARGEDFFEIRIGIHTGPVVAGIVGIKKFAYDIWGDAVNTASRMESSGEAGKINISGSTYELIKGKFHCIPRGKIQAKNKGEIEMYFVEREKNS